MAGLDQPRGVQKNPQPPGGQQARGPLDSADPGWTRCDWLCTTAATHTAVPCQLCQAHVQHPLDTGASAAQALAGGSTVTWQASRHEGCWEARILEGTTLGQTRRDLHAPQELSTLHGDSSVVRLPRNAGPVQGHAGGSTATWRAAGTRAAGRPRSWPRASWRSTAPPQMGGWPTGPLSSTPSPASPSRLSWTFPPRTGGAAGSERPWTCQLGAGTWPCSAAPGV